MKKSIWKFTLKTDDFQEIQIPENAEILDVQVQRGRPCIWALVDEEAENEKVIIRIVGTGHPIEHTFNGKYLGTYQLYEGSFVGHVFIIE